MRAADTEIKKRARNWEAEFDTPARKQVLRVTKSFNRCLAKNHILETQYAELQQIVSTQR